MKLNKKFSISLSVAGMLLLILSFQNCSDISVMKISEGSLQEPPIIDLPVIDDPVISDPPVVPPQGPNCNDNNMLVQPGRFYNSNITSSLILSRASRPTNSNLIGSGIQVNFFLAPRDYVSLEFTGFNQGTVTIGHANSISGMGVNVSSQYADAANAREALLLYYTISECPGDFRSTATEVKCRGNMYSEGSFRLGANSNCSLEPNKKYYFNMIQAGSESNILNGISDADSTSVFLITF